MASDVKIGETSLQLLVKHNRVSLKTFLTLAQYMFIEKVALLSMAFLVLLASTVVGQADGNRKQVVFEAGHFKKMKGVMGKAIQLEVFEGRLRLARNWQVDWKRRKDNRANTPREICSEFEKVLAGQGLALPEALATRLLFFLYQQQEEQLTDLETKFCKEIKEQEKNRHQTIRGKGARRRPPMLHLEHGESNPNFLALDAAVLMLASKYRDQPVRGTGGSTRMRRTRFHGDLMCGECSRLGKGAQLRFNFFENESPFRRFALSDHLDGNFSLRYSDPDLTIDLNQKSGGEIRMVVIENGIQNVISSDDFATLAQANPRPIDDLLSPMLRAIGIAPPNVSGKKGQQ